LMWFCACAGCRGVPVLPGPGGDAPG
jgi:hypothetical protein